MYVCMYYELCRRRCQHVIADWIYQADYVIELLTYLSVTADKQLIFADST